ncbi:MAG: single-stranded-DNA-specific exonuclease RecJ [Chthonomonas sp.]|nr:single-stranded-DNA-specific exonuclease RecJ [Chthonomonas sp.]
MERIPHLISERSIFNSEWDLTPFDENVAAVLQTELGISGLVSRLLVQRGYRTPESAERFLNPRLEDLHDPRLLPDFAPALKEILSAKEEGRKIFIHGDYDVDGITSAALFSRFLRRIGCEVITHVPHRIREGYGINMSAVEKAKEEGASVFLTCDCGSGATQQIQRAREYGMRIVVTDHHELHDGDMPDTDAFVNLHRSGHDYPFDGLSGVGVVFKLCAGIAQELKIDVAQYYRAYLDLAALGTVADVMSLVDENRIITAFGCNRIQESRKPGIKALMQHISIRDGQVTPRTIGYQLGPRLNAAGRIDDAVLPLRLLLSEDDAESAAIAGQLEAINTDRREQQDRIIEEAREKVLAEGLDQETAIVVGSSEWHPGIIGLVAGRLAESFYRPAFVMTYGDSVAKGSARTIPGYHLADALKRVTALLETHGGHEAAAGFSTKIENVEAFRLALQEDAASVLTPDLLVRRRRIDAETTIEECSLDTLHELEQLAPFGTGNQEPTFLARNLTLESLNPMPSKPQHVKGTLRSPGGASVEALGFNMAEALEGLRQGDRVSVVFEASINRWNGRERPQWVISDLARES